MKRNYKKAFTLIEMMIVVIIIGILMSALLPKLTGAQAKARDTARQASLSQISNALTMYFSDQGTYPTDAGGCTSGQLSTDLKQYMASLPKDPQNGRIAYGTLSAGCKGVFAYSPMKNNGADNSAYALVANVESFGKTMNFVLYSGGEQKSTYFSGANIDLAEEVDKRCDQGVVLSGNANAAASGSPCSTGSKQGWATRKAGEYSVYVNIGG